jgi:hypothetical protein
MNLHKEIEFTVKGASPLIMHNGQLCDPLNPYAKRMKEITSKKTKTEADFKSLYDIEWEAGLYKDEDGRPYIPGENIEAMLTQAGKKRRLGDAFKAGLLCDGDWTLGHDGPKTFDKLKADGRYRDVKKVKVKQNSVMRCRPIFASWSLTFVIKYLPDLLNESQVVEAVKVAGQIIGLGDYRPKYGRFVVA